LIGTGRGKVSELTSRFGEISIIGVAKIPQDLKDQLIHFQPESKSKNNDDYEIRDSASVPQELTEDFLAYMEPYVTDPAWKELNPYTRLSEVKRLNPGEVLEWHREERDDNGLLAFVLMYLMEDPSLEYKGRELVWLKEDGDYEIFKPRDGLMVSVGHRALHGVPNPLDKGNIVTVAFRLTREGYLKWKNGK